MEQRGNTGDFRGLGATGALGHLLPGKLVQLASIVHRKGSTGPSQRPQALEATHSVPRNSVLTHTLAARKASQFE